MDSTEREDRRRRFGRARPNAHVPRAPAPNRAQIGKRTVERPSLGLSVYWAGSSGCARVGEIARMCGEIVAMWRVWRGDNTIRACGDVQGGEIARVSSCSLSVSKIRERPRAGAGRESRRPGACGRWLARRARWPVGAMTPTHGAHIGERHGESASGADRGSSATLPAPRAPPRWPAAAGIVKGDGGGGRESPIRPHPYFCFRFRFSFCVGWVWREELLSQCFHGVD